MKRWVVVIAALSVLVGGACLLWTFVFRSSPEEDAFPTAIARPPSAPVDRTLRAEPVKGGVYGGVVLDTRGAPVPFASVVLVAVDTDFNPEAASAQADPQSGWSPSSVAILGPRIAEQGRAAADGKFEVSVDARTAVRHVFAYQAGFMPEGVSVEKPTTDLRIVLQDAGAFVGTVVDDQTGKPVPGVDVSIYLQSKVERDRTGAPPPPLAALQRFAAEVLGPLVWQIPFRGDSAIHVTTDEEGGFRFAPIGNEVQLEFVLTHPDYLWSEHDLVDGQIRRTVVQPGQTVERTFRLKKGNWIAGKVVGEDGKGLADVRIEVEHVVQQAQHWYYRDRKRIGKTGADGSFRLSGLSVGPYNVTLRHPSFGVDRFGEVPANKDGLQWGVRSVGGLAGVVSGLDRNPGGVKVEVLLEALDEAARSSSEKRTVTLDANGAFHWPALEPHRYSAWVRAGNRSSLPQEVEIRKKEETSATFELGGGGGFEVDVRDARDRPLDPVKASLVQVRPQGDRILGQFVSRGGHLTTDGIPPGRYRLMLRADGYVPEDTAPFEVADRGAVRLEPVQMFRQAYLKLGRVEGPSGRPPEQMTLYVREGDGPERRVERGESALRGMPVKPGPVTVRAETATGQRFEETRQVGDGATETIDIRLR